jgi:GNAT superfamily N-acetyltransferase
MALRAVEIVSWSRVAASSRARAEIEAIFFQASATQSFASPADRAAFCERWLGRFLVHFPADSFLAVEKGQVIGYVIGSLADPACDPRFADVPYFRDFAGLSACYPAHLHINIAGGHRGQGLGARLIEAFARHAGGAGVPGVHVVTADGSRNNAFYLRCGFDRLGTVDKDGKRLVFLGRRLGADLSR